MGDYEAEREERSGWVGPVPGTASDDQDGGGLPFLLVALGLAVAVASGAARLRHRKDGS